MDRGKFSRYEFAIALRVVLMVALLGTAWAAKNAPDLAERHSLSDLRSDFDSLVLHLREHPAPFHYTPEKAFKTEVSRRRGLLRPGMSTREFFQLVAPIVALVKCGHTRLLAPEQEEKGPGLRFPGPVFILENRMFVRQAANTQIPVLPGAEVLSINHRPTARLLTQIKEGLSADGDNQTFKGRVINEYFPALSLIYLGCPSEYQIVCRNPDSSSPVSLSVPAMKAEDFEDLQKSVLRGKPALGLELDEGSGVATLDVHSFGYYGHKQPDFLAFLVQSFGKIRRAGISRLILDLRGNAGGDPGCAAALLAYLIDKPTPYFDPSYASYYPELAKAVQPSEDRFEGKVVALADGGCFSAAGHLCALLKSHKLATLIGEETAGSFRCNDAAVVEVLYYTRLRVRVARRTYVVVASGLPENRGVPPDIEASRTVEEILKREDGPKKIALQALLTP